MDTTLIRLAGFIFGLTALFLLMKVRKMEARPILGLYMPKAKDVAIYGAIFLIWIALTEFITYKLGLLETGQWKDFSLAHIVLRGLSICLIGPVTEELIFRGILFTRLRDRFGLKGAILVPAILFALLHLKIDNGVKVENIFVLITFTDAIYYGFIRSKTNSIYIPILLHALGNSIAMVERLW